MSACSAHSSGSRLSGRAEDERPDGARHQRDPAEGAQGRPSVVRVQIGPAARLDWSRCVVGSSHVRALKGGSTRAPIAGRPGTSRFQASLDHRRTRHPARGAADRRQP
uniref:Uncharacterized protein n=1 Tax=Streptomyces rochei TaxID=1928 RepID=A0A0U3SA48_STRRO|nr:hypothetical protein [Streptomyces rochei]